ncbi:hypothetical protein DM860_007016 [Cuscuta australis]|uniref:NAD(P)-binding protein n=1 Tax=Cuscuta australis TaxID=267555 RepID=A0A328E5P2_9ASTE|nr:hypothetical protein DM860_007016 [Cuscuta australis]
MDDHKSEGLSWADQWDPEPLPAAGDGGRRKGNRDNAGKSNAAKKFLTFQWVALITGGDSGIGRAVSYYFTLEGATVAFTYVKGQEVEDKDQTLKILHGIKAQGAKDPIALPTDVGFEESCKQVVDQVEGSCIINTASLAAYQGNQNLLDYSSTKGAIVAFTRSLSQQLISRGIHVNAVAPGPVWTPLQPTSTPAEKIAQLGSEVPLDRADEPYEIAPSYVFLASNDCASYITGQVVHPNGGSIVNA